MHSSLSLSAGVAAAPLGPRERRRVLLICSLSLFIVGIDITAVNVALPSIAADLGGGVAALQWTVDGYTVVMASLLMLAGATADRLGRRRVFVVGLATFTLASVLCSLATSIEALIAARVLQAVGAAMLNPVAMSIVTNTFTDPAERARAIGIWAAVFGLAMGAGPLLGGALIELADWRAIFWLNLPVGIAAIALTLRFVPESSAPTPRRADPLGQVAVTLLLAGLTFAIIEAPGHGAGSTPVLIAAALAIAGLATLLVHEPRREEPLIDLRFFRSIPFSSAVTTAIAAFAAFGAFLFLNTLYLQEAKGLSALEAGVATAPLALMTAVLAPISGRMVARSGPRQPLLLAGVSGLAGSLLLVGVDAGTPLVQVVAGYLLFGTGFGLVNAPVTNAAVSGMPRAQAGVAAGITTTSRQVGITLGVAVAGAIVASHLASGVRDASTLPDALHPAWWFVVGAQALVLLLAVVGTTARAHASARRTAAALNPEALVD